MIGDGAIETLRSSGATTSSAAREARRGREPRRRRGQHHGRPVRDRRATAEPTATAERSPPPSRGGATADDEDTLDELDGRPGVDTAVVSAEAEFADAEAADAPRPDGPTGRRPSRQPLAGAVALVLVARPRSAAIGARRLGAAPLSERTRELLNLVVVGLLTALGFASVYIARQDASRPSRCPTRVLPRALPRRAPDRAPDVPLRGSVPAADGRLLTAVGVTVIYRLDPDDAFRQAAGS